MPLQSDYALFAEVVEQGSLSAAARKLKLSPAMVSKRLARLEERLGARLLNRTTRRLSPTDPGQTFYENVVAILSASREAEARVAGAAETPMGRLRISAPTSFGRMHIAPYLKPFLDAHPRVTVEFDLTDGFVDLFGDRVDLAVRIAADAGERLTGHRLAPNHRLLCASPAYLSAHGAPIDLADLSRHRLLAADGQLPWRLERDGEPAQVQVESFVATNSSEVVRELAVAGLGIALRSTWDIASELRSGALVPVLPDWRGASEVHIFAVHLKAALVPIAVRAFVAYLQMLYASPPWEQADC
jgi:DNA-binding transcriptional LysR family regulator